MFISSKLKSPHVNHNPGPAAAKISTQDLKDLWSLACDVARVLDGDSSPDPAQLRSSASSTDSEAVPSDQEEEIDVEYFHRWGVKTETGEQEVIPAIPAAVFLRLLGGVSPVAHPAGSCSAVAGACHKVLLLPSLTFAVKRLPEKHTVNMHS